MSEQNRNLDDLDPAYAGLFLVYLAELEKRSPWRVIVTETRRTKERQRELRARGASRTLHSNHLLGKAVDIALLSRTTGEANWSEAAYRQVYELCPPELYGLASGLEIWGWDAVHLQLRDTRLLYPALTGTSEDVWGDTHV